MRNTLSCPAWAMGWILSMATVAQASEPPRCAPPPRHGELSFLADEALATELPKIEDFWARCVTRDRFKPLAGSTVELAYAIARQPGDSPAIVIASGRTEHYGKYKEVVYDFWRAGYSVYLHDHRGQGLSSRLLDGEDERQKGHVEQFQDYVDDLHAFVERHTGAHARRYLVAHSMGGGIATLYLQQHPRAFAAAALASPMHQPNTWPLQGTACSWSERPLFLFGSSWFGFKPQPYTVKAFEAEDQIYTRSRARYESWFLSAKAMPDETRIGGVTRRWLREACLASDRMLEQVAVLTTPLMVLQAKDDKAVWTEAQDRFCAAMAAAGRNRCAPDGQPVPYDNVGHELFIERSAVRDDVMRRILGFFQAH